MNKKTVETILTAVRDRENKTSSLFLRYKDFINIPSETILKNTGYFYNLCLRDDL